MKRVQPPQMKRVGNATPRTKTPGRQRPHPPSQKPSTPINHHRSNSVATTNPSQTIAAKRQGPNGAQTSAGKRGNKNLKNQVQIKKKNQPNIQKPVPGTSKSNIRNPIKPKFDPYANLPATHSPDFKYILEKKLEICSNLVLSNRKYSKNPVDIMEDEQVKMKTMNLSHILRLVAENAMKLTDEEQDMIVDMICSNIMRPLRYTNPQLLFAEVPQILPDPEWPHLDFVYLILYHLQLRLPTLLTYHFVRALFPILNSSDINERVELIRFIKEFANFHLDLHDTMIKDFSQILDMHIELSDRPFAVWTILPIFKMICDISADYGRYDREVRKSIVPLLKDKYAFYFFPLVNEILFFYTEGCPSNARHVVEYLLQYWPKTSITKQSSYTTLLAEMLHKLSNEDLNHFLEPVFKLFADEIVSTSPKLAESSLTVWLIPDLEEVINKHPEKVLEIMVPSIMKSANGHWWDGIRDIGMLIMSKILAKHDLEVLKEVTVTSLKNNCEELRSKYDKWTQICNAAQENNINVSEAMDKVEELFSPGFVQNQSPIPTPVINQMPPITVQPTIDA